MLDNAIALGKNLDRREIAPSFECEFINPSAYALHTKSADGFTAFRCPESVDSSYPVFRTRHFIILQLSVIYTEIISSFEKWGNIAFLFNTFAECLKNTAIVKNIFIMSS